MPATTLNDEVKVADGVVFQRIGEETVLLNLDTGFYYGLDSVGTRMLELLAERRSLQLVFDRILEEYEVAPHQLRQDLLALVDQLKASGLVEVVGQ